MRVAVLWLLASTLSLYPSQVVAGHIQADLPISPIPPATCKDVPKSTALVTVGELKRIRIVLDPKTGKYDSSWGGCATGVDDENLSSGPRVAGPITWAAAQTVILNGDPQPPKDFLVLSNGALRIMGAGKTSDYRLRMKVGADGVLRGAALRPVNFKAESGKFNIRVATMSLEVHPSATDLSKVGRIEMRMLSYDVDPPLTCPPKPSDHSSVVIPAYPCSLDSCTSAVHNYEDISTAGGSDAWNCGIRGNGVDCIFGGRSYWSLKSITPVGACDEPGVICAGDTTITVDTHTWIAGGCDDAAGHDPNGGKCGTCPDQESGPHKTKVTMPEGELTGDPPDIVGAGSTPVHLDRLYNSADNLKGPFGRGWTHKYNLQLVRTKNYDTGDYYRVLRWADGRRINLKENGGGFDAPPGWRLALSSGGGGTTIVSTPDKTLYTFNAGGFLQQIQYANYNVSSVPTLTLTTDSDNRLVEVASSAGNQLTFGYNAASKVSSATGYSGQSATYGYTSDGRNLLATATDPENFTTTYNYDSDVGRLTKIEDHEARTAVEVTYGTDGRVSERKVGGETYTYTYDDDLERGPVTVTNAAGQVVGYGTGSENELTQHIGAMGETTNVTVDSMVQRTRVSDALGRVTAYSYSPSGIVTSVTAPDLTTTTIEVATVAGVERPTRVTFPSLHTYNVTYDATTGFPEIIQDKNGAVTELTPDTAGRVTTAEHPSGRQTQIAYDSSSGVVTSVTKVSNTTASSETLTIGYGSTSLSPETITDSHSHAWGVTFDKRRKLRQVVDPLSGTTVIDYDSVGNITQVRDARSHSTSYGWDGAAKPLSVTNALSQATAFGYNLAGDLTTVTNHRSEVFTASYDASRRVTSVLDPLGGLTTYSYDAASQTTGAVDPRGNLTQFAYSLNGRLSSVKLSGATTPSLALTYHPDGELASLSNELNQVRSFSVDASGRTTSMVDPAGKVWHRSYDVEGRVTSVTDPLSRTTTYSYDGRGRLATITYPDSSTFKLTYDVVGLLTLIDKTQAGDVGTPRQWVFEYDQLHRLKKRTDPLGNYTEFGYDEVGNVNSVDEPGSGASRLVTTITYDEINRPTEIERPDETLAISYDDTSTPLHGVTITITRPVGSPTTVTRHYDALNRLVDETLAGNAVRYEYDAASNVTDVYMTTQAAGETKVLEYTYNARNLCESIKDVRANRTATLEYDALNRLRVMTYPSGVTKTITYGSRGQITNIVLNGSGTNDENVTYTYDDALQVTKIERVNSSLGTRTLNLGYDPCGRLISAGNSPGTTEIFSYDAAGNLKELTRVAPPSTITTEYRTHDAADQLTGISGARTALFGYDNRGNMLSWTEGGVTRTFQWDSASRLVGITGATTVTADYQDDFRLTALQDNTEPLLKPVWSLGNVISELTTSDAETSFNVHDLELDSTIERGPANGTGRVTHATDHLMSPAAIYDDSNNVTYTGFSAYGGPPTSTGLTSTHPVGFAGARAFGTTGLYYLRNRVYSPELGRFLSRDPLGFEGGWNLYGYADGNPIQGRDPLGLAVFDYPGQSPWEKLASTYESLKEGIKAAPGIFARNLVKGLEGGFSGLDSLLPAGFETPLLPEFSGGPETSLILHPDSALINAYQELHDQEWSSLVSRCNQGSIKYPRGIDVMTFLGGKLDRAIRRKLYTYLGGKGLPYEGPGARVMVNRNLWDPSGSGDYRRPDIQLPITNQIVDGTIESLGSKLLSPQMRDIMRWSKAAIRIIRPRIGPRSSP